MPLPMQEILWQIPLNILYALTEDLTTSRPIIWATDEYASLGRGFSAADPVTPAAIHSPLLALQTRAERSGESGQNRTKARGEVFTPASLVGEMVDVISRDMRERRLSPGEEIGAPVIEITCGEAPFLTARRDAATGNSVPPAKRRGVLDRKLALAARETQDESEDAFLSLVFRALKAVYGYELCGDSLLIARLNVFLCANEAVRARAGRNLTEREALSAADIIAANLIQADGLTGRSPAPESPPCLIVDHSTGETVPLSQFKFAYAIGNPPYQEPPRGGNSTYFPAAYHKYMEATYAIAERAVLVTPARFLFRAGASGTAFADKMLSDPHLRVERYEPNARRFFPSVELKCGVAVTYRDATRNFGAIGTFVRYPEQKSLIAKVTRREDFESLAEIVSHRDPYHYTPEIREDYPGETWSCGGGRIETNAFSRHGFFREEEPPGTDCVRVYGRLGGRRVYRYLDRKYIAPTDSLQKWKVFVPAANGGDSSAGAALVLGPIVIGAPGDAHTATFLTIGGFETESEARACLKYVKTKFARAMIAILKIDQSSSRGKYRYVPRQNFTPQSDLPWNLPVPDIDRCLYRKYDLSQKEIAFIETHIKEMP